MIYLFLGSYTEVPTPLVKLGRSKVDFGQELLPKEKGKKRKLFYPYIH